MDMNHDHQQQHHDGGLEPASSDGESMMMMSMMKMYFHFGLGDLFLVRDFVLDSPLRLILVCVGVFVAAIILEAIDYTRGYLSCRCRMIARASSHQSSVDDTCPQSDQNGTTPVVQSTPNCCHGLEIKFVPSLCSNSSEDFGRLPPLKIRLTQAGLQFIRTGLSLTLMLVAMTYNVCLILPIMLGSAVGFYVFYRSGSDSASVCH